MWNEAIHKCLQAEPTPLMIQTNGDIGDGWTLVRYKDRELQEKTGGSEMEYKKLKLEAEITNHFEIWIILFEFIDSQSLTGMTVHKNTAFSADSDCLQFNGKFSMLLV